MRTSFRAATLTSLGIANQSIGPPTATPIKDRETIGFLTDQSAKVGGVRPSLSSLAPQNFDVNRPNAPCFSLSLDARTPVTSVNRISKRHVVRKFETHDPNPL